MGFAPSLMKGWGRITDMKPFSTFAEYHAWKIGALPVGEFGCLIDLGRGSSPGWAGGCGDV